MGIEEASQKANLQLTRERKDVDADSNGEVKKRRQQ